MKIFTTVFALLILSTTHAYAQSAMGTDKWTADMDFRNRFALRNFDSDPCSSSEVQVPIPIDTSSPTTGSAGLCIEKNQRSATTWEEARNACARDKKRLPEPAEFMMICRYASSFSGLTNMLGDLEWASNFYTLGTPDTAGFQGVVAPVMGDTNCVRAVFALVATNAAGGGGDQAPYRCVR